MAPPQDAPLTVPPPQVPRAPLPMVMGLGTDDAGHVLLRVETPAGVAVYFLTAEGAVNVGERLASLGRQSLLRPATKRLVRATGNGKAPL